MSFTEIILSCLKHFYEDIMSVIKSKMFFESHILLVYLLLIKNNH